MSMHVEPDPLAYQQRTLAWRREGLRHAVVPTMGALHEGHFALIRHAREIADRVSVTIFVNPTQFGPNEDLDRYPRTLEADLAGCRELGADLILTPQPAAIYPPGFQTKVIVEEMTKPLCGANRPGHFNGVTQVVMKLLMLAQPDWCVMGWKDAQQLLVLRRMVRDLCVPVEIVGVDTVRESDGLAMSSRNKFLTPEQRTDAVRISQGLAQARETSEAGERNGAKLVAIVREHIEASPHLSIEYCELRDMDCLEPLVTLTPGNALLAVAVKLSTTRLIDNVRL